ncbi:MAG: hypothetical protein JNJ71_16250 [Rubrivivax sp.]|nr:hypothetical protein [Rubrivivax sp.]
MTPYTVRPQSRKALAPLSTCPAPSAGRRRMLHGLTALAATTLAAGCAQITHVATGEMVVKDRLVLTLDRPWNQFAAGFGESATVWTQDGVYVDALRFYVGLKDGELLAPTPSEPKGTQPLAFRSTMRTAEIVTLFETLFSRGGSTFTLDRVQPETFAGQNGFRFDFSSIRKIDDVRLRGTGWGAVRNGELFVITYTAPRLSFYERNIKSVDSIVASARIR